MICGRVDMAFRLPDVLRHMFGRERKERPTFDTDKQAYDFCRNAYAESGGVPDELRRTFEFYSKNFDDGCTDERRPFEAKNR